MSNPIQPTNFISSNELDSVQPSSGSSGDKLVIEKKKNILGFIVPFFLGAALYLSVVFAVFSALPLVFAHLRFGRLVGVLASLSNLAIVFLLSGRVNAAIFFVIALALASIISECLKFKVKLEVNVVLSVGLMMLVSVLLLLSYSYKYHVNPFEKLDQFVGALVTQIATNVEKYKESSAISTQDLEKFLVDPEMTKKNILYELPSAFTILLLAIAVGNILLLIRVNLSGIRDQLQIDKDFFKSWKAPEHLIWPTLIAGFGLVIEVPGLSEISLNVFKVFMAIYALQGLAILNYLFDLWGAKGFFRPLGYILSLAILLPLVISLGFFDLWFNFREKLKT